MASNTARVCQPGVPAARAYVAADTINGAEQGVARTVATTPLTKDERRLESPPLELMPTDSSKTPRALSPNATMTVVSPATNAGF
ncbi:MAG: hypothetical protein ACI9WU_002300 [Myxococcota bacterium]|jgi:hypothetical protein